MVIEKAVVMYSVECDECGEKFCFRFDEEEAYQDRGFNGWKLIDGRDLCYQCAPNRGDQ